MHGIAYYITWTVVVIIYHIAAFMLYHSEKGVFVLFGLLMYSFYIMLLLDCARIMIGHIDWFPISESVGYGSLGGLLVYGVIVWIAIISSFVKRKGSG